jgi:hypothetical protein
LLRHPIASSSFLRGGSGPRGRPPCLWPNISLDRDLGFGKLAWDPRDRPALSLAVASRRIML